MNLEILSVLLNFLTRIGFKIISWISLVCGVILSYSSLILLFSVISLFVMDNWMINNPLICLSLINEPTVGFVYSVYCFICLYFIYFYYGFELFFSSPGPGFDIIKSFIFLLSGYFLMSTLKVEKVPLQTSF